MKFIKVILAILVVCPFVVKAQTSPILLSPDGKVSFQFFGNNTGAPAYQVFYHGQPVIMASVDSGKNDGNMALLKVQRSSHKGSWQPVIGEQSSIPDKYNELILTLSKPGKKETFQLIVRAYNEGIGLRYFFPDQTSKSDADQSN